jgi:hypothetical protein
MNQGMRQVIISNTLMGISPRGFEPLTFGSGGQGRPPAQRQKREKSRKLAPGLLSDNETSRELRVVIDAWPGLPENTRRAILLLTKGG